MVDVDLPRAGFWRRAGVVVVDTAVVMLALQCLLVLAFALTDGKVQGRFGVTSTVCESYGSLSPALIRKLNPPPPEAPDSILSCQTRFLGLPMAAQLIVSRAPQLTEIGTELRSAARTTYALNTRPAFVDAFNVDLIANLLLPLAIVWQWALRGRTLGGRLLRLRVIRTVEDGPPVPGEERGAIGWEPACKRLVLSLAATAGLAVPAGCVAFALVFLVARSDHVGVFWVAIGIAVLGAGAQVAAWVVILNDIVWRRDPIYDRWARTAAVVG
jgi:hypothetical protein